MLTALVANAISTGMLFVLVANAEVPLLSLLRVPLHLEEGSGMPIPLSPLRGHAFEAVLAVPAHLETLSLGASSPCRRTWGRGPGSFSIPSWT